MEVNIVAISLMIIVHTMGFINSSRNTRRKWCVRKDEHDNHGTYTEYEMIIMYEQDNNTPIITY